MLSMYVKTNVGVSGCMCMYIVTFGEFVFVLKQIHDTTFLDKQTMNWA